MPRPEQKNRFHLTLRWLKMAVMILCIVSKAYGVEKDQLFDLKICNIISNTKISDKEKIYALVETSIHEFGRYPRYGEELFRGTPKWSHYLNTMITNNGSWVVLKINNNGCNNMSKTFLDKWYESKSDEKFKIILFQLGYIDDFGFYKRNKSKISKRDRKIILTELSNILNSIYPVN